MKRPFPAYIGVDPYIFVSYAHEDAALLCPEIQSLKDHDFDLWGKDGNGKVSRRLDVLAARQNNVVQFVYDPTTR